MLSYQIPTSKWLAVLAVVIMSLPAFTQDTSIRQSSIGNRQWATDASQLPVTGFRFPVRGLRQTEDRWPLVTGSWQLATGNWQPDSSHPVNKKRLWFVAGTHVALWAGSYIALNKAWYADYPKESFHFFNDNREWQQMDKAGHVWTAYQIGRISGGLWQWTGLSHKQSTWLGGISSVAYQSIIEIQDGFSSEWGFSWGDMAANVTGSALYVVQELAWKEQRLQVKMSYWPYDYTSPDLKARRDQLFGESIQERILKDYNSQTYWLSANLRSFLPGTRLPKWLNLAAGYSAEGMLGGMDNKWTDKGGVPHNRTDIARTRHFYLSPDIDLTKIRTKSKFLRTTLSILNMIKIPAPTLELTSKGKLKGHLVYF